MLEGLKPAGVFKFFEELCCIPHGSFNEQQISDYLVKFAKDRNLFVVQDEKLNVIIRKPGTPGYENRPEVILQGHMDMVCEKNKDVEFDFSKDALKLSIEGDFINASGTTLGADNGIAVAYILALMDSNDIPHPPLCGIMTTMEEVGLMGAANVSKEFLTGKYFLNMDASGEGLFWVSCAGGATCCIDLPCQTVPTSGTALLIEVTGLKGGHSGIDIDKNRGNSNVCLARTLQALSEEMPLSIDYIKGGSKDNAIPREAECRIIVKPEDAARAKEVISGMDAAFKKELTVWDPEINVRASEATADGVMFSDDSFTRILSLLTVLPTGMVTYDSELKVTETSSNLAVMDGSAKDGKFSVNVSVRSSRETKKRYILSKVKEVVRLNEASLTVKGNYPGWEYNPESPLRQICADTYKELSGKDALIEATHGGLECGLFSAKNPGLDIVAFGPEMYGAHTPEECMSISSAGRVWDFLLKVLEKLQ